MYTAAIDLDPSNSTFYSNRSACHLLLKNYELAVKDASLVTRLSPDQAKGWGRLGAALFSAGQYEEATPAYAKAATLEPSNAEYRAQTVAARTKAQRGEGVAGEESRRKFYMEKHKKQGLEEFQAGNYVSAVRYFTQAIDVDPCNHLHFSNRSAAHCKIAVMPTTALRDVPDSYRTALADAEKCIKLNPTWAKGHSRKGASLMGLKQFREAKAAFDAGLQLDASEKNCVSGAKEAQAVLDDIEKEQETHNEKKEADAKFDEAAGENPDMVPLPDVALPSVYCHKCGKDGHFATNCREKIVKGVEGGGYSHSYQTCRFCGKTGHSRQNCPVRLGDEEAKRFLQEQRGGSYPDAKRPRH